MRNVVSTLGRGVSVAAVVVVLSVPEAQAGWFSRSGERDGGRTFDPSRIVQIIKKFVGSIWGDELSIPHP